MSPDRDLVITRDIAVPRDKLYRYWTEPALIKQWFAPKPTNQLAELAAQL
ncbi:SRPBCC domain-containing protein [Piscinibacter sp.]|jgi:uncharacterized protein YndB with AHSA1/START domain